MGLEIKKTGISQSRITDENKEIILSVLFNDPHLFGYVRNTWSLRSLAKCLTEELDIPISFKHLQREYYKIWVLDVKDQNWNLNMGQIMMTERRRK